MKEIVQKEAKVLREIAKEVKIEEISTPRIQRILREMKISLASQDDGVAIAAPQIGYTLRIFVVSGKVANIMKKVETENEEIFSDYVYINPVIKKISKSKKLVEEGCLSVRYLYGKVNRSTKATVEAFDENGNKFIKSGTGLLAQIFQHETDHLNGVLFIDKAKDLEEIMPKGRPAHQV